MAVSGNIIELKTSWTKYDCVRMIEIIGTNKLDLYLNGLEQIDLPVLKSYLGIKSLDSPIPDYWKKIQSFPSQKKLFTLAAGIFTHHENIKWFSEIYATKNMVGVFKIDDGGKHKTNLRSALVVSGAASNSYRKKLEVPYDLSGLYSEGEVGSFFKELIVERLIRVGYSHEDVSENLLNICFSLNFNEALSLSKDQFTRWIEGKKISQIKSFSYNLEQLAPKKNVQAIRINQWLTTWNDVNFDEPMRRKPEPSFYMFKMDVRLLKHLSDVHRRRANKKRLEDNAIQRDYNEKRSSEIKKFVQGGFPWSTLNEKEQSDNKNLKMPGLLPTAIVANILGPNEKRGKSFINDQDLISIENISEDIINLRLPSHAFSEDWDPELKPIEIIDGQHRLMSFDETDSIEGNFEVPVIAYYNLDRAWQAYLFYVINIKPKKINTSLGYDLYPLLRTQEWLENSKDGLVVYRESRAQELVEALWLYDGSPWNNRISMLGASDTGSISQAAFIRALSTSYLKKNFRRPISGLFADVLENNNYEEIKWVRAQQAAFLILLWEQIALISSVSEQEWALALRRENKQMLLFDSYDKKDSSVKINDSFLSKNSMLSKDQGVTGISMFSNDFFFVVANYFNDYDFNAIEWKGEIDERQIEISSIDEAINQFRGDSLYLLIQDFAKELMHFDWRTSSANFDNIIDQDKQKKYKGSSGYGEIWRGLLDIFKKSINEDIKRFSLMLAELTEK